MYSVLHKLMFKPNALRYICYFENVIKGQVQRKYRYTLPWEWVLVPFATFLAQLIYFRQSECKICTS